MPRTPDEDTTLALVKSYVENQGGQFGTVLDGAEWDTYEDHEKELTVFRLKDKSSFPHRGVAVAIDTDAMRFFQSAELQEAVGGRLLQHLREGLPVKESREPYFTDLISVR